MYNNKYRKSITKTKKGHQMLELTYEATTTSDERILELDEIILG